MVMLASLFQCCHKAASSDTKFVTIGGEPIEDFCCSRAGDSEFTAVVDISADVMDGEQVQPVHALTSPDPFALQAEIATRREKDHGQWTRLTPRQQFLKDQVRLPAMMRYPVPLHCSPDDPEEVRISELLRIYQVFVMDMHRGVYMTQVTMTDEYSDIHCQLSEDMTTLRVDQGSGCIVEFPLPAVTRMYRVIRNDGKVFSGGTPTGPVPMPPLPMVNAEHIVVVEFMKRKLVLVFTQMADAQSFLMCMELLVRISQEADAFHVEGARARQWPEHARSGEAAWGGTGLSERNRGLQYN